MGNDRTPSTTLPRGTAGEAEARALGQVPLALISRANARANADDMATPNMTPTSAVKVRRTLPGGAGVPGPMTAPPCDDTLDEGRMPPTLPSAGRDQVAMLIAAHEAAGRVSLAEPATPAISLALPSFSPEAPPVPQSALPFPASELVVPSAEIAVETPAPASSRRLPPSVAPDMPQIPKSVVQSGPIKHAPGIVSTQAIPLITPASRRKPRRSALLVAFAAALIGGALALLVLLVMKPKSKPASPAAVVSGAAAAASPAAVSSEAPRAPAEIAAAASGATVTATADPAPGALTAGPRATTGTAARPAAAKGRPKSDRIED